MVTLQLFLASTYLSFQTMCFFFQQDDESFGPMAAWEGNPNGPWRTQIFSIKEVIPVRRQLRSDASLSYG